MCSEGKNSMLSNLESVLPGADGTYKPALNYVDSDQLATINGC